MAAAPAPWTCGGSLCERCLFLLHGAEELLAARTRRLDCTVCPGCHSSDEEPDPDPPDAEEASSYVLCCDGCRQEWHPRCHMPPVSRRSPNTVDGVQLDNWQCGCPTRMCIVCALAEAAAAAGQRPHLRYWWHANANPQSMKPYSLQATRAKAICLSPKNASSASPAVDPAAEPGGGWGWRPQRLLPSPAGRCTYGWLAGRPHSWVWGQTAQACNEESRTNRRPSRPRGDPCCAGARGQAHLVRSSRERNPPARILCAHNIAHPGALATP